MRRKRTAWKRLLVLLLVFALCGGTVPVSAGEAEKTAESDTVTAAASSNRYDGEINALSDEAYEEFGLSLSSPDEFDPDDETNPLEDYEATIISELYLGAMNVEDHWTGDFRVMNDVSELSASNLSVSSMSNDLVGDTYSYKNNYEENKDDYEVQTTNSCSLDYDGDGTDELVEVTLYVNKTYSSSPKKRSCMDIRLYDLTDSGTWKVSSKYTYCLVDSKTDDPCFVDAIEADNAKAYTSIASGDFDGDGLDEIAVYVPSMVTSGSSCGTYVSILDCAGGSLSEITKIYLSTFNSAGNKFDYTYSGRLVPVVSLACTSISGQDDLVINVSQPQTSSHSYNENGQGSVMAIYHINNDKLVTRYSPVVLTYGYMRMRFCSAVDADINGNGTEELIVGGYLNEGWSDNQDVGSLSDEYNLIQAFCWNDITNKYEQAWSEPLKVEANSSLKCSTEMMEPAAMAAANMSVTGSKDYIFLEGIISSFSAATTTATSEAGLLAGGAFIKQHETDLNGTHSAFISQAYAATFSTSAGTMEQIVILQGDHRSTDNDVIHYDLCWAWTRDGAIYSTVTDNDYITADEDDNGTFISICPLNCDEDTVYYDYQGKTYGWSEPELYTVLQSPPYWSELQYNGETYGTGEVEYEITYGTSSGTEGEWSVGVGFFGSIDFTGGVDLILVKLEIGVGLEVDASASYLGSYLTEHSVEGSYSVKVAPGEDYAVVFAVPLVVYHYKVWSPGYTVTEDHIKAYNEMKETDSSLGDYPYEVGDTVDGQWVDYTIESTLAPAFTHMSVEEYNELAEEYDMETISEDIVGDKTIGDPSTYPDSTESLEAREENGEIENLYVSPYTITTQVGEASQTVSYSLEDESETSHGFDIDWDAGLYMKMEEKVSIFLGEEIEVEAGLKALASGGCSWVSSSSSGTKFSATIVDLPSGSDSYVFTSQVYVYDIAGDSGLEGVSVLGFTVDTQDSVPPEIAQDLRVVGTTETAIVLKWDRSDYLARQPASYIIYAYDDDTGSYTEISTTSDTYYVVTGLKSGTTYQYTLRSCTGENGTGAKSVYSRYISAKTKTSDTSAPVITGQPQSVIIEPTEQGETKMLTVTAEPGEGMAAKGYELTYQWQKYTESTLTKEGSWVDIEGATGNSYTLPTVTTDNAEEFEEQTHYRVVVKQILAGTGDNTSVISQIATMYIDQGEHKFYDTMTTMKLDTNQTEALEVDGAWFIENGTTPAFLVSLADEKSQILTKVNGSVVLAYSGTDAGGTEISGAVNGTLTRGRAEVSLADIITVDNVSGSLRTGDYEVYAVYTGGISTPGTDNESYYLASQSDTIPIHVVDVYRITYHLDGGVNDYRNPSVLTNESEAVEIYDPIRSGYTFDGWYLDENLTQPLTESVLDPADISGDVELYASWTPVEYEITYELDGGINSEGNPSVYTVEDGTITLQDPVRDGYNFMGWYLDAEFTEQIRTISYSTFGNTGTGDGLNVTVYARWEEIEAEDIPFDQDDNGTYLISSYEDLLTLAQNIQTKPEIYASANYEQTTNISCGYAAWPLEIGTEEHPFTGTYEGNDFYILGLCAEDGVSGLFGMIGESGTVQNLSVVDFSFENASSELAGGIAGVNLGTINGCGSGINITSAAAIVIGSETVALSSLNSEVQGTIAGGIAGKNGGLILNSRSNAVVSGSTVGGIAGVNEGEIINVYNTGTVTGAETAGGIAGKNSDGARIQYGYNCGAVEAPCAGGIAGSAGNTDISDFYYQDTAASACGDLDDSKLSVTALSANEMRTAAFADTLNTVISAEKDNSGLMEWTRSSSKNEGYPMLCHATTVQQTLHNDALGVSVSGQIPSGARLKLLRLSNAEEDDADTYAMIRETFDGSSLSDATLMEGWHLALVYSNDTYCVWDGDLTITITPETSEAQERLSVFHVAENGECTELATQNDGERLIVTSATLGSFAVLLGSEGSTAVEEDTDEKDSDTQTGGISDDDGSKTADNNNSGTAVDADGSKDTVVGNEGDTGDTSTEKSSNSNAKTGDQSTFVPILCLILSGTVLCIAILRRRQRADSKG
ncbi:MAG: InlB B-repeat-containing protein [Clostridiales bacterium]|nr:InlB B-repeat-containing protein [Clostridiales bacterium]